MQFSQTRIDPLAPLSSQSLGQWAAAAMLAASALSKKKGGGGGTKTDAAGDPNLPGGNQSVPRQPGAVSTVSPAIQVAVSPQISPTMVQQQDSAGASVGANPTQYMPGGQSADTGVSPWGAWGAPGMPETTSGVSPLQPYGRDPRTGAAFAYGPGGGQTPWPDVYQQGPSPWAGLAAFPWTPLVLVGGGIAALYIFTKRGKRK